MIRASFIGAVLAALTLLSSRSAFADDPGAPSVDADLARASALLDLGASDARDRRVASIAVGAATGVVLVPTGTALVLRSDDVSRTVGTSLLAGGGGALFIGILALPESRSEHLRAAFLDRRASGLAASELLRRTEAEWSAAATASAARRSFLGKLETVVAGIAIAGGATLLLAPPVGGLSRDRQYNLGATCLGVGVPFLSLGVHSLLVRTPEEQSWAAYRAGRSDAPSTTSVDVRLGSTGSGPSLLATATF
jgi:hypothetical protein